MAMKCSEDEKHNGTAFDILKCLSAACFLALWVLWLVHLTGWPVPIHINASRSMPRGIWSVDALATGERVERGDVVVVTPPERARELGCVRAHQVLLKYIAGVPGDRVCVREGVVRLSGWPEPLVRTRLRPKGSPGPRPLEGCFELERDELWVASPHERSCDSRFFGPITHAAVRARATTLLTWETGRARPPIYPPHHAEGGTP